MSPLARRRLMSAGLLVVLAPLIAEVTWGSTPFTAAIGGYLLSLPIYGAGALLIRESVRRTRRGWPSILLLGLAYGLVEEGLILQDLFWPVQGPPYSTAGYLGGIDTIYTLMVVPLHAVWSVAIPILLVELVLPAGRREPYLGRPGLVVTVLFFGFGVVVYTLWARAFLPRYDIPVVLLVGCAVLVAALVVTALTAAPARSSRPASENRTPSAWLVLTVAVVGGFVPLALLIGVVRTSPVLGHGVALLVPVAGAVAVVALVGILLRSWSNRRGWDDRHRFALVSGALLAHTGYGVLDIAQKPVDRLGLITIGIVMAVALAAVAVFLRRRVRRAVAN